uniref:Uncharacterized protein n=1 Tax=Myoviridae sp. ctAys2 TaxID=2825044 RepID=A0A8S5Q3H9_9CAUD|nr:MAG TPA: hypothetical protein [Myoviridae sp. ctAys2]
MSYLLDCLSKYIIVKIIKYVNYLQPFHTLPGLK